MFENTEQHQTVGRFFSREGRVRWSADARPLCPADDRNRRNLETVESALLVLCLDRPLPASFNARPVRGAGVGHSAGPRDETNMAHQMLHGGGSAANGANRWFDKTMQLVVSLDGACGLCYEHSPAEGVAVVQLVEQAYRARRRAAWRRPAAASRCGAPPPAPRSCRPPPQHAPVARPAA
ncbi:Choline O-acetyltransferase, partial [Gryllus bimaculatus]